MSIWSIISNISCEQVLEPFNKTVVTLLENTENVSGQWFMACLSGICTANWIFKFILPTEILNTENIFVIR